MATDQERENIKKIATIGFRTYLENGDRDAFSELANELLAQSSEVWTPLVSSFWALLHMEDLATAAGLAEMYRPKMWWMPTPYPGNFGDILTPYILWHAFGVMPRWVPIGQADGLCVGSIIKNAREGTRVWGAGAPRRSDPLCPAAVYTAVRGPLTREVVVAWGGQCAEIYGDPAVLLPELYKPEVTKTYKIGIIPHVSQEAKIRSALSQINAGHIKVISLRAASFTDIERVIRDIMSCNETVTTSLHGLIVSHAYAVPSQLLRLAADPAPLVDPFKIQDYRCSVGLTDKSLVVSLPFKDTSWLARRSCTLPPSPINRAALRAAFPFPVRVG